MNNYSKPYNPDQLREVLKDVLSGEPVQSLSNRFL